MYDHTQTGRGMILLACVVFGAMIGIILPVMVRKGPQPLSVWIGLTAAAIVAPISMVAFSRLRVEIREGRLWWSFGRGFPGFSLSVSEIRGARIVRNPWILGLGIHYTPWGMLYNVGGGSALEVTKANGRRFRIGTDDPDALLDAVLRASGAPRLPA